MNFPLFVSLTEKPCLVVGGGAVAKRKCETLLEYGAHVTVVAKTLCAEFRQLERDGILRGDAFLRLCARPFEPQDLEGCFLAFVATEDEALNREIVRLCRRKNILVNVADIPELCDFYFPALVRRGDVVVGISTGGRSPALAGALRRELDALLPESLGTCAQELGLVREEILAQGRHPAEDKRYQELAAGIGSLIVHDDAAAVRKAKKGDGA